jgi:DNA-binding response OmpR family regulator
MSHHVLIIESDPWMGEHFERVLTRAGFSVSLTSNAYSAIDMIDEQKPHVIVMGLLLSGAGGLSLLHELQSYNDTAKIPIIVCTNVVTAFSDEELAPYGVRKILDTGVMKPEDMPAAVRSVLA